MGQALARCCRCCCWGYSSGASVTDALLGIATVDTDGGAPDKPSVTPSGECPLLGGTQQCGTPNHRRMAAQRRMQQQAP